MILGTDPDSGIFGRGRTLEKAFELWHDALKKHLADSDDEDYVVSYIKSILHKPQRAADLKTSYGQFTQGRR